MKHWLSDPVVLICAGIIVVGIFSLFWAIGKLRRLPSSTTSFSKTDDLLPSAPDLRDIDFRAPAITPQPSAAAAPINKDVAQRLDSMSQRLAEMQTVLQKQSPGVPGGALSTASGVGQGFSPETIDKLLKIIGNVIQQVDILQKSMNTGKDDATAASPFTKI